MQIPEWVRPGVWGAVIGAGIFAIVGFGAGLVVTSGAAEEQAELRAEKAVLSSLTPICVAQFKAQAKAEQTSHLAALEDKSSWSRGDYVEEQGWANMPGSVEPNDAVADACASELLKLAQK